MYEEFLEGTGLTKNESSVYIALLKVGKSKAGDVITESKVSSGKIYETLQKLIDKGLVKLVSENGVKHFIANNPKSLFDYIKEKENILHKKEEELEKILPALEQLRKIDHKIETVSLVKGFRGISPLVYDALEEAKEIKIMGLRSSKDVKFNNFWKNWHRKRISLKKNALMLFSDRGSEYWKFFKSLKYTKMRETLTLSPSSVMIVDHNVFIFSYEEEFICIHIISKPVADSFSSFFDSLWRFAEK